MAREQRVSNERRKELEELDPFQENLLKIFGYLKTYKKQLILMGLGFATVIIIFSVVISNIKSSENKASQFLNEALTKYNKINDPKEAYLAVENDFPKILEGYSNTSAGKMAKLKFAKICYNASKYDKAFEYYKGALAAFKSDPTMENLILSALGNTCLALDNFEEAKVYFDKILNKGSALLEDEALFNLGIIAEKTENKNASHDFFKKIVSEHPESPYKALAQSRLN